MATYVVLLNFTDQGIAGATDSPARANAAGNQLKKMGGRMKSIHWTIGPYDAVSIVEAPDDETLAAWALAVGALGNVRTTTLRAFDRNEFGEILGKLG